MKGEALLNQMYLNIAQHCAGNIRKHSTDCSDRQICWHDQPDRNCESIQILIKQLEYVLELSKKMICLQTGHANYSSCG